jgi:hypothetical protein
MVAHGAAQIRRGNARSEWFVHGAPRFSPYQALGSERPTEQPAIILPRKTAEGLIFEIKTGKCLTGQS